jgi:acid-sensing ion channel, other
METLRQLRIPPKDVFFECKFKDQIIKCDDHLEYVGLERGLCYTFNGFDVYRKKNQSHVTKQWTIDEGYTPTASLDTYPQRAIGVGAKTGFSILMGYKKTALETLCESPPSFWV